MSYQPENTESPFLPTTMYFPNKEEELLNRITKFYTDVSSRLNIKQIGIFDLFENLSGQQWFTVGDPQTKRQVFRTVFQIGAIATGATSTTPHGLSGFTAFTHIYGTCITDVVDYRTIPYASATALNTQIQLAVTATNIVIVNGAAAPNITSAIVVLEYLKN
ncbi:hypothetical protein HC928_07805 [bacterium]|nr:hypothetical protein [bacterium]